MKALHKKPVRIILASLIGVCILAAAAFLGVTLYQSKLMKDAYGPQYAQRPYTAATPQLKVDPTRKFAFDLNKSIDFQHVTVAGQKRPNGDMTLSDVAQVFSDPALQHKVPAEVYQLDDKTDQVFVSPSYGGISTDPYSIMNTRAYPVVDLALPGKWNGFSRYYLARYIDADGKKLARPVVTMFTIKGADFALHAPLAVHTNVTVDGKLRVSWTPVEGATDYRVIFEKEAIYHLNYSGAALEGDVTNAVQKPGALKRQLVFAGGYQKVTGKTSLDIDETALLDGVYATSEDAVAQNRAKVTECDGVNLYGLDVKQFSTKSNGNISVAVIAFNGSKRSPMEFNSIASLLNRIPVKTANYAQQLESKAKPAQSSSSGAAPKAMTMADGSTALIKGQDGKPTRYTYPKGSIDWSTYKEPQPKTTPAQVPYPVNGSSELVKFLASNLMADNYYLDVTTYMKSSDVTDLDDALDEAVYQNPYILYDNMTVETVDHGSRTLAYISSFYQIKDRVALRGQLWEKVRAVDAQIIKSGMDNEAKAHAINAWIIAHASYDFGAADTINRDAGGSSWDNDTAAKSYYDRYAYAQNATGVMLRGKGVCASYAMAFKALADRAQLPCVYVTGATKSTGEGHAWNKVYLNGRWLIVDSAWDDTSGASTYFFGITDNSARADRTQDPLFMTDAYISRYAN